MNIWKIAHINARSLLAGFIAFKEIIQRNDYDIFLISESWLGNQINDDTVEIGGYNLVREDRRAVRWGGVCIYIKTSLKFEKIEVSINNSLEQLWIKVTMSKKRYCVGVIYHPPNTNLLDFLDTLEDTISNIMPSCDDLICMGDININILDLENTSTIKFYDFLSNFDLTQLISEPTRLSLTKVSLIDVIICSGGVDVCSSGVDHYNNLQTDHGLIFCYFKKLKQKIPNIIKTFRNYKNFDYNSFQADLEELPLQNLLFINNIENKLLYFNKLIISLFDKHAPFKTVRCTKPKAPWLTDNIKMMISMRDDALKKFKNSGNAEHFLFYKNLRNLITKTIRAEKKAYLNFHIATGKSKRLWKDLDELNIYSGKKKRAFDVPSDISNVNEINNFFINSVKNLPIGNVDDTKNFYSNNILTKFSEYFTFSLATSDQIFEIIKSINSNALGFDEINVSMLKYCCPHILPYITHLINCCLLENYFPNVWKTSMVTPLPKTNHPQDYKDLRPISILPPMSKILERVISIQIKDYLDKYDILPQMQSGFRKNHSCTTALSHILDDILEATDEDELTVLILLDYSKAFDCINHEILLAILHYIGFHKNAVNLIRNYLKDRKQIVRLNNEISLEGILDRGVPQGSILGPLLFSIYTSQLYKNLVTCKSHYYADDTQLYKSFAPINIAQINNAVNADLQSLVNVSQDHCLCINPNKSTVMLFGKTVLRNKYVQALDIKIAGKSIDCVSEAKNLGLIIDTDLRFKSHVNSCIKRAFCNLKNIYSSKAMLSKDTIKLLCDALVLSHFAYCDIIYGPCLDVMTSKRIQRVQNSCTRLICGIRRREHVTYKIREINWLNMSNRRLLHSSMFFHKIVTTKSPQYLYEKIRFRTDVHNINIRRKSLITPPAHKTALYERSFTYNISKVYNKIPANLRKCTIKKFQMEIRRKLWNDQ